MDVREEIKKIRWRHTIDLGNGIFTNGTKNTQIDLAEFKFPEGFFQGKSVIDVGACDGFFSFYAEKHGATDILAVDPYRWTYDDRWSGMKGFNLAHKILGSKVRTSVCPLEKISEETVGKFDIVLFLGVFYHLPNPFTVMEAIADICKETIVVETVSEKKIQTQPYPLCIFYPNGDYDDDKTTYWGTNPVFMNQYIRRIGFKDSKTSLIYGGFRSITYGKKNPDYKKNWGEW